jgi:hypothetical protein
MKSVISMLIIALLAAGGSFGGQMLKKNSAPKTEHAVDEKEGAKGKDHAKGKKSDHGKSSDKGKGGDHGDGYSSGSSSELQYFSFSREFVVPIMADQRVESLVIINLNLEVESHILNKLFSIKPKLRDNIMTTLVELSNDGKTLVEPTSVDSYETIRSVILSNLNSVVASGVENVLIMDLAKQEV